MGLEESRERLRQTLFSAFAPRAIDRQAVVTNVARDGSGHAVSATVTIDGVQNQSMRISYGERINQGDTWLVRNTGAPTSPYWTAQRRLFASTQLQATGPDVTLPTPDLLQVTSWTTVQEDRNVTAVFAYWLALAHIFGGLFYDVELYVPGDAEPIRTIVLDDFPETDLVEDITATDTIIPRLSDVGDPTAFPTKGRIAIGDEHIDYNAATGGRWDSGTGTGAANSFTVAGATWIDNEWTNYCLEDSAGNWFLISGNTATVLVVSGTPASGAFKVRPCFSGCTRGVASTTASVHSSGDGVYGLSVGCLYSNMPAGSEVSVRVRARNASGAVSGWTNAKSHILAVDTEAPAAPAGVTLAEDIGGVWVRWTSPTVATAPDLAGFTVYEDSDGSGTTLLAIDGGEVGMSFQAFIEFEVQTSKYFRVKAYDVAGNVSSASSVVSGTSLPIGTANRLVNTDYERDTDGDDYPDSWGVSYSGSSTLSYGVYGYLGGQGVRINISDGEYFYLNHIPGTSTAGEVAPEIEPIEDVNWIVSVYVKPSTTFEIGSAAVEGKLILYPDLVIFDDIGVEWSGTEVSVSQQELSGGWYRIFRVIKNNPSITVPYEQQSLGFRLKVFNEVGTAQTVQVDRAMLEVGNTPSDWSPSVVPGGLSGPEGLRVDTAGIVGDELHIDADGVVRSNLGIGATPGNMALKVDKDFTAVYPVGLYVKVQSQYTGTSTNEMWGALIDAYHEDTQNHAGGFYGLNVSARTTAGAGTLAYGHALRVTLHGNATGGTITNGYGIRVSDVSSPSTYTNLYGLYIGDVTGAGTLSRAIHSDSTAESYLGGDLEVDGNLVVNGGEASGLIPFANYDSLGLGISTNGSYPFIATVGRDAVVRSWYQTLLVSTTNDGSNYWTITLRKDATTIATLDTSAISADTWAKLSSTGIDDSVTASSRKRYEIYVTKTGSPGNLNMVAPAVFIS